MTKRTKEPRVEIRTAQDLTTFAEMFAEAELHPDYWVEAIELCTTKKQRMALGREIVKLLKEARKS